MPFDGESAAMEFLEWLGEYDGQLGASPGDGMRYLKRCSEFQARGIDPEDGSRLDKPGGRVAKVERDEGSLTAKKKKVKAKEEVGYQLPSKKTKVVEELL